MNVTRNTVAPGLAVYNCVYWGVCALMLVPIWIVAYPPPTEFPAHLQRCYIINQYDAVALFKAQFGYNNGPMPNLAMELISQPLFAIFTPFVVGKLLLSLIVLMFAAGVHALGRAINGTAHWMTVPALLLLYNSQFTYGFANFLFGVGLFLFTTAFWIKRRTRLNVWSLLALTTLATACYLAHLSSFAFLAFTFTFLTLYELLTTRPNYTIKAFAHFIALVPALILHKAFMTSSGSVGELDWGTPFMKLIGLTSLLRSYSYALDAVVGGVGLLVLVLLMLRRNIRFNREFALLGSAFFVLFLICPIVLFTSYAADLRFVLPGAVFILLSARFIGNEVAVTPRFRPKLATLFVVVVSLQLTRVAEVGAYWLGMSDLIASQLQLIGRSIPPNQRVFTARYSDMFVRDKVERALNHFMGYATTTQHVTVSDLPAYKEQQPIFWRKQTRQDLHTDSSLDAVDWHSIKVDHDYIWAWRPKPDLRERLNEIAVLIDSESHGYVYRVKR